MTAKRNPDGDLEVVKVGGITFSYRMALMLLVASATPMADPVYRAFGLKPPVTQIETKLDSTASGVASMVAEVHEDVNKLAKRAEALDAKIASLDEKIVKIDFRLSGFQVDFDKYRITHP